jgi:hypothetical protein
VKYYHIALVHSEESNNIPTIYTDLPLDHIKIDIVDVELQQYWEETIDNKQGEDSSYSDRGYSIIAANDMIYPLSDLDPRINDKIAWIEGDL